MNQLFDLILQYQSALAAQAEGAAILLLRIGAAMAALPAFGEQTIPARIRLIIALMFTAAIAPTLLPGLQGTTLEESFLPEVMIGLFLGLSIRLFVLALMTAGTIAANATSLSQLFPSGAEPQPAISQLLVITGLALAVQSDLHLRLIEYLILSYDLMPAGQWPQTAVLAQLSISQSANAFSLAFMIAMPFVIASLLYNVALGVINRAMPQLMVSLVGAPALSLGGLVLLALVCPLALVVWLGAMNNFLAAPFVTLP